MPATPNIQGHCDRRFAARARGVRRQLRASRRDRRRGRRHGRRRAGRRSVGRRTPTRRRTRPWERDTLANVYSLHQGHDGAVRASPDRARPARPRRARREVLAGVRAGRQGEPAGALAAVAPGRAGGGEAARCPGRRSTTGTRCAPRSPPRSPGGRPGRRTAITRVTFGWLVGEVVRRITGTQPRHLLPRRDRRTARRSTSTSGCPSPSTIASRSSRMLPPPSPEDDTMQLGMLIFSDPEGVAARAFMNPPSLAHGVEHARVARGGDSRRQRARNGPRAGARLRRARPRRRRGRRPPARRRRHRALPRGAVARPRPGAPDRRPASGSASCCRRIDPTPASGRAAAPSVIPARAARRLRRPRDPGRLRLRDEPHGTAHPARPARHGADRRGVRVAALAARRLGPAGREPAVAAPVARVDHQPDRQPDREPEPVLPAEREHHA